MRIGLLGAAGIIGRDIAQRLAGGREWDILLADRRDNEVRALAKSIGAEAAVVDVKDASSAARALKGCDLVLNATWYYFNLDAMEASLAAGAEYMDLGGLYHTTRKQLALGPRFEREGRLALLGCGKAPGITNVLAAWGAARFDRIQSVRLRSGRRPLEAPTGFPLPYSPQTLIDEFTLRPIILDGGKLHEIEPLSRTETVRHPEQFGTIEYVATLHSELATLPAFLGRGLRDMDFQVALAPETTRALELLSRMGLLASEPVAVEGHRVAPRDVTAAVLSRLPQVKGREIWITEAVLRGTANGASRELTLRVTGDETQNGTSIGAVAAADLVRKRLVKVTGVHAPETALPAREFFALLGSAGLKITESLTEERTVNP